MPYSFAINDKGYAKHLRWTAFVVWFLTRRGYVWSAACTNCKRAWIFPGWSESMNFTGKHGVECPNKKVQ